MGKADRLRELVAINRVITRTLDYDEVLRLVVEKTAALTEADASLLLLADANNQAKVAASVNVDQEKTRRFSAPLDERINAALRELLDLQDEDAYLAAPVVDHGYIAGILLVYRRGQEPPSPEEEFLVSALADQTAIALEHAVRYWKVRQDLPIRDREGRIIAGVLAVYDITERQQFEERLREYAASLEGVSRRLVEVQEEERRRLARELHDEIGQLLTSLQFAVAAAGAQALPETATGKLDEARALIDEALTRVRALSFDLRPALLDHLGLVPALRSLLERYTASTGIHVDLQHAGLEGRLAPEVETAAYRIVQEAVTNVARHASVTEAAVRLWLDADTLKVQVEDRGVGFDPEAILAGPTNGLPGMQERLMLLGGQLEIESAPGSGTHLFAELPLHGSSGEETR